MPEQAEGVLQLSEQAFLSFECSSHSLLREAELRFYCLYIGCIAPLSFNDVA